MKKEKKYKHNNANLLDTVERKKYEVGILKNCNSGLSKVAYHDPLSTQSITYLLF